MSEGVCKLCDTNSKLVKSHIIPRSFYGEYSKTIMTGFDSLKNRKIKYKKGIYATFLCLPCEQKFQKIDHWANSFLIREQTVLTSQHDEKNRRTQLIGFRCTKQDKHQFAYFALTVLWRAHASQRSEYGGLKIGKKYEQFFKTTINSNLSHMVDLSAISLSAWFFEGSDIEAFDSAFVPLVAKQSKSSDLGLFKSWLFGFPGGRLQIRLGGDNPKYGFFELVSADSTPVSCVLWSSNLSETYVWLLVPKVPRDTSDDDLISSLVGIRRKGLS